MHVNEDHAGLHGIAFAELVAYTKDSRMEGSVAPVFKLADLAHLYKLHLEQQGVILEGCAEMWRNMMLSFDDDIGDALNKACDHDKDNDAMLLPQAVRVVRKECSAQTFHSMEHLVKNFCKIVYQSHYLLLST